MAQKSVRCTAQADAAYVPMRVAAIAGSEKKSLSESYQNHIWRGFAVLYNCRYGTTDKLSDAQKDIITILLNVKSRRC